MDGDVKVVVVVIARGNVDRILEFRGSSAWSFWKVAGCSLLARGEAGVRFFCGNFQGLFT